MSEDALSWSDSLRRYGPAKDREFDLEQAQDALRKAEARELEVAAQKFEALAQLDDMNSRFIKASVMLDEAKLLIEGAKAKLSELPDGRATVPATATATGWQPIETAPKDQIILLYRPGAGEDRQVAAGSWFGEKHYPEPYWRSRLGNGIQFDQDCAPAYWMPLPAPPTR